MKTDAKKSRKGLKITAIIIGVIAVIICSALVAVGILTAPIDDSSEKAVAVGGLLKSENFDYQADSAKDLEKNPMIKIMQIVWKFCAKSDAAVHAKQTPPDNLTKEYDIPYIDDGNRYHMLDVYYPENATEKMPVIIDIHGGGWMYGDKSLNEYYNLALADRGFVVFSISYRLVPDVTVNEQLWDCMEALKWISDNMNNYPCDSDNIMLTGDSAGGMFAAYCAVLLQSEELRNVFEVTDADLELTALLLTSPVPNMNVDGDIMMKKFYWGKDYQSKATYKYMNLDEIIDYAELPPTYLITSSGDSAHSSTVATYELLKAKGVDAELKDYSDLRDDKALPHVFSVLEPFDEFGSKAIDGALGFYRKNMK
ncbi:MAG: alpha/beta hydrolase [Oscillospiraceae bacterium]|nr:alpha/beta hydrolase [Oscillospiraceae bacterium]